MIRLLRRLVGKIKCRRPSTDVLEAEQRLREVRADDHKINEAIERHRDILRENHLGPMIAALFERRHR